MGVVESVKQIKTALEDELKNADLARQLIQERLDVISTLETDVTAQLAETESLKSQVADLQAKLAEVPPVVEDTTPYDQAALDQAKADAAAAQKAVDDQVLAEAQASLQEEIASLGLKLKQKDADALEEAVADKLEALATELRQRTVPAPVEVPPVEEPAPVDPTPVEETPVEETPVETPAEEPAPTEEVPAEEAPVEEPTPVDPAPEA